jgi:hypothetical protein
MIPSLPFGRTGDISTRVFFCSAALSRVTRAKANRAVEPVIKYGVDHIEHLSLMAIPNCFLALG